MQDTGYFFDYYALWIFGRLTAEGKNPYDQTLIREMLQNLGVSFNDPLSGNMPWSLWIYAIYAVFPFPFARVLWLISSVAAITYFCIFSSKVLSKTSSKAKLNSLQIAIAILSFSPVLNNLRWGQSNFVLALGFAGYLYYYSRNNLQASGLALSFTLFKPHLFLAIYGYLAAESLRNKDFTVIIWCTAALLLQCFYSYLLSASAFEAYPLELSRSLLVTKSFLMPSLPLLLARFSGFLSFRWMLPLLGLFLGFVLGFRKKASLWKDIGFVLSLSLLLAPYSWSHTFLVLFIPYITILNNYWQRYPTGIVAFVFAFSLFQYWISIDTYLSLDFLMICIPLLTSIGTFTTFARRSTADASACA